MSTPCCTAKRAPKLKHLDALTTVYSALSDPTRLRMLALIGEGEICVCHIHDSLGIPQPTASRHLAYLRKTGLVETRRAGIWIHYRLATFADPVIKTVVDSALHALTHTEVSARDHKRLEVERAAS
jgi:ArsR family transcriptional regulator, arsenate/arsenite/antimonite-responsive transcriptional repressor